MSDSKSKNPPSQPNRRGWDPDENKPDSSLERTKSEGFGPKLKDHNWGKHPKEQNGGRRTKKRRTTKRRTKRR